jgi:tungstate transport system substrate-binding protein
MVFTLYSREGLSVKLHGQRLFPPVGIIFHFNTQEVLFMKRMFPLILGLLLLAGTSLADVKVAEIYGTGSTTFSLATGSPGELGLLKQLAESFSKEQGATMQWIKAGSGESLDLLRNKQVDMIMVHAPQAEKNAVAEGWATKRVLIGSNEFFIVGPAGDPAGIAQASTAADAYQLIARSESKFFSRGDNSGTHKKEMSIWKDAGISPTGAWYVVTRDFMTATLKRANDERGYFMTDSSTWAAEQSSVPGLKVLFRGDKKLVNTYHTLVQPKGATPGAETALLFVDFVSSEQGQEIIRNFGRDRYGEALYNDAEYAKQYDD